ncbi:hypothetical protein C8R44DRAFT_765765 [Mycena epipterygia]|nr:hypothetical protein C8R44DRAFT_765765 [Mycena epipterygia]
MANNSDTESEPESIGPVPFLESITACEDADSELNTISNAIEEIRRIDLLDFETIMKDANIHAAISLASTTITSFLDCVHQSPVSVEDSHQRLADFGELFKVSFLTLLFEHRKVFHKIAAQSLASGAGSSGSIVCWVDVILSKLGDAISTVASGVSLDHTTPLFPGSAEFRVEDNLRAACQLPADWQSVAEVIASDQASPAAKRLALRLTFAAFVLGPRLCRNCLPKTPSEMIKVLDRCVNQTRATGFSASRAGDQLAIQERLNFAMIVSLFAVTDRHHPNSAQGSQLRPHTLGCLLNILQNVIHPNDSVSSLELASPPDDLDPAQLILLRWGDTVSWCWETWDDHRVANVESIVFLTSMWLLHSDRLFFPGNIAAPAPTSNSTASSIAMLRLLHCIVRSLSMAHQSVGPLSLSTTVVSGACYNAVNSMKHLLTDPKEDERWIVSGLCRCLLSLFVLLMTDSDEQLRASDYILEALSLIGADTLHICLIHVQDDTTLRFSARLDERVTLVQKYVSTWKQLPADRDSNSDTHIPDLFNAVRSTLNFAVIVWFSQTRGCLLRQSVSPLLSAVIDFLLQKSSACLPSNILGDAILTASAAARNDPSLLDENRESIWRFVMTSLPSELGIASSFAHYITTSDCLCNPLYCAEAWRYLGEVLLLTLKRHYIEEQEPLALLICPTVCGALIRLLQADSAAAQFMLSTPFTLNLCADLKSVCEGTRSEEYFVVMKERLDKIGGRLLDQVSSGQYQFACADKIARLCASREM